MTPRDLLLAAMRGQPVDRVPLALKGAQNFADEADLEAKCEDGPRRQIMARVLDHSVYWVPVPSYTNRFLCTPPQRMHEEKDVLPSGRHRTRGVIDTPKGELTYESHFDPRICTGWMVEYPCKTADDIRKIQSVPWERPPELAPWDGTGIPAGLERRAVVRTGVSSPMVCVAAMMKFEQFLEYTATDREWMLELTQMVVEREVDVLRVLLSRPGVDYVWMGGSEWVTPPMGSPALYDATVQEQERTIIDYVHQHSDAIVHVHCHGNVRHALQRTIERGADYTEPVEPPPDGDITMAEAKAMSGGRITLGGNIEARVLYREPLDVLEAAVHAAFAGGKERFVLTTSEQPPAVVEPREYENYMRLIDLWEELSPIA